MTVEGQTPKSTIYNLCRAEHNVHIQAPFIVLLLVEKCGGGVPAKMFPPKANRGASE